MAGSIAATVMVAAVGIDFEIGGLPVRSHSALRVGIVAAIVLGIRLRLGVDSLPAWIARMVLLTLVAGSIGAWFRFLLTRIGGADSFGYVSASQLLLTGRMIEPAAHAEWLSAANRLRLVAPLGWVPAADGTGIVPAYPLGLPMVMASFSAIAGQDAVFFVAPVLALLTLVLVYRVTREWFDREIALMAVAIVAWNPVFLTYAKQPMSDVPAAFWVLLSVVLALQADRLSAFGAGLAAGAAVMTRPVLLAAAAAIPFIATNLKSRFVPAAVGAAIGVAAQMAIQAKLYGSPFASGYGANDLLFSLSFLATNLGVYGRQLWVALGVLWLAGVGFGLQATPSTLRWRLLTVAGAVTAPYLFYLPFDHWETLRFLLPGLVLLAPIAAAGMMRLARIAPNPWAIAAFTIVFAIGLAARSETLMRRSSVWDIQRLEERYALAAGWVDVNTPKDSVVLANQHSGSIRWYGNRHTIRWDFIEAGRLVDTVRELSARAGSVYVALEGREVEMFNERFGSEVDRLRVDHVGSVRNVQFRRLVYLPNK